MPVYACLDSRFLHKWANFSFDANVFGIKTEPSARKAGWEVIATGLSQELSAFLRLYRVDEHHRRVRGLS